MSRLLLIALLLLSSSPAYAEWVLVTAGKGNGGFSVYADPSTILGLGKGDLVKIWVLRDFKTVQTSAGVSFLSVKSQTEYDCSLRRSRISVLRNFSRNMGAGETVFTYSTAGEWELIMPESIGEDI